MSVANQKGVSLTTAIIGVGNLGRTVARHLVDGAEPVVLAAADEGHAEELADELGPHASAASVEDAIAGADVVVLATWVDQTRVQGAGARPNQSFRGEDRRGSL
jgi:predicted dinucleotide-binding enzyme